MDRFLGFIIAHKKSVIIVFILLTVLSVIMMQGVKVNYNLVDYLPAGSPSTTALEVMDEEFSAANPNLRIMMPDVSIAQALEIKQKILDTEGIDDVMWLDDSINIKAPLEMADKKTVEAYYKDGAALYMVTAGDEPTAADVLANLREALGDDARIAGDLADRAGAQNAVITEVGQIMIVMVPLVAAILLFATNSWFEPVLFVIIILVSILLNMGTNRIFGQVSFITQGVAPILQLAVSMDYIIFLLASFENYRQRNNDPETAMRMAMKKTASTIIASGATTVIGFLALTLMRFGVGKDMGLVLGKGVLLSMFTTIILLPVVMLSCLKLIDRLKHKSFMPRFEKFSHVAMKLRYPFAILILLLIVPAYLGQQHTPFSYGSSVANEGTRIGEDTEYINEYFGKSTQMVLMVPRGQWANEISLNNELKNIDSVTSVISYVSAVGAEIPADFLSQSDVSQLLSENYSRIIITAGIDSESDEGYALVEIVRDLCYGYYGDSYYLCGTNVNVYDIKDTITSDSVAVNLAGVGAVALILLLTFKSASLPIILVLSIESAIWINMAVPYFLDQPLPYIAYLIVSSVQLGATIDYAILFTEHYLSERKLRPKLEAIRVSIATATPSILVPALILTVAGMSLGIISSNYIIGQVGTVLARGAVLSTVSVIFFLPALLSVCDKLIEKTTRKPEFFSDKKYRESVEIEQEEEAIR